MAKYDNTTTKALSYVLANMYPGAFASYRGHVFRVTGPSGGPLAGMSPDMEKTQQVLEGLVDEEGKALLAKLNQKLNERLAELQMGGIQLPTINVLVPEKVDLRLEDDALDFLFCTNSECGKINTVNWLRRHVGKDKLLKCTFCGSPMEQAPVWIPVRRYSQPSPRGLPGGGGGEDLVRNMGFAQMMCPMLKYKPGGVDQCKHPESEDGRCPLRFKDKIGSMRITDPNRPIDSLRRFKPDCPRDLEVEGVEFERLYGGSNYWYKMDFPRESITSSLKVSAVQDIDPEAASGSNRDLIEEVNEVLDDVKRAKFNSDLVDLEGTRFAEMRVLEVVYGFSVGSRRSGFYRFYVGVASNQVPGRLTRTQGFVVSLGGGFFDKLERLQEEHPDKWGAENLGTLGHVALHSLKHALLVLAPMNTGFEPDKFYGSYDLDVEERTAKVYVYDAEEGGNGGFASIIREPRRFQEMLDRVVGRLDCRQRECPHACKQCLFVKNCGEINRHLNRHLLKDLELLA